MPIEDVFSISGRGTVVTGRIERGIVKVGDEVEIVGLRPTVKTVATGVEMFRKLLDSGEAGDNVGVLLRGTKREEVERGQVLAAPGSITPHTNFQAEAYILTKEEGGRHTPFFTNYRPQFYFRTTDVTGTVKLPEGTEMVMPGDNISMEVELIQPIAMDEGLRFAIREGGRTVGAGVVACANPRGGTDLFLARVYARAPGAPTRASRPATPRGRDRNALRSTHHRASGVPRTGEPRHEPQAAAVARGTTRVLLQTGASGRSSNRAAAAGLAGLLANAHTSFRGTRPGPRHPRPARGGIHRPLRL